jgi:polyferredoxin
MKQTYLKTIRMVIALGFFGLTVAMFLDVNHLIPPAVGKATLYLQFVPSLLQFIDTASVATAGFIIVLLLTLLFGRVFCSTICPLGTLQDILIRLSERFGKPRRVRFRYKKPHNALRYGILLITFFTFLYGSLLSVVSLLDPFSNFGRILADLLKPVYIGLTNLIAYTLEFFGSYALHPLTWRAPSLVTLIFPLLFLGVLVWLCVRRGRLYCNTLCPVGTLLGLVAKFALFKIAIAKEACGVCANCSIHCKASCIRLKTKEIDFSRCVACFDCISVCPEFGIGYKFVYAPSRHPQVEGVIDTSKRLFLGKTFLYLAGLTGLSQLGKARPASQSFAHPSDLNPVSPPGSQSVTRFTHTCTACHLCVSVCPTQVLQPAFLEYGLSGLLQPRMDYHVSFCNFDCTRCGEVCPSGAILPLSKEGKQTTQLGIAQFLKERCIVYTDQTACGACAEHCPTKAVQMLPYLNNLTLPQVREAICIGCGACEYACPVRPHRAIVVPGHVVHRVAQRPETQPLQMPVNQDFPF